jgi:hypothetical protein
MQGEVSINASHLPLNQNQLQFDVAIWQPKQSSTFTHKNKCMNLGPWYWFEGCLQRTEPGFEWPTSPDCGRPNPVSDVYGTHLGSPSVFGSQPSEAKTGLGISGMGDLKPASKCYKYAPLCYPCCYSPYFCIEHKRYMQADASIHHVQLCYMVTVAVTHLFAVAATEYMVEHNNWYDSLLHKGFPQTKLSWQVILFISV